MSSTFKLLPLLLIVAFLSFSVRLTEVITGMSNVSGAAFAKSKEEPVEHAEEPDKHAKKDKKKEDTHGDKAAEVHDKKEAEVPVWRDASDSDLGFTDVKMELFKDLSKRSDLLDKQERKIQVREALLQATKKELDRKYQELNRLRDQIKDLLDDHSAQEDKRIASLVKIYEGMKPKDAARIFDTLDIDVLISVVSKMSERKVSPVLAAMNPERVRTVTIMLAEQKNLPKLR